MGGVVSDIASHSGVLDCLTLAEVSRFSQLCGAAQSHLALHARAILRACPAAEVRDLAEKARALKAQTQKVKGRLGLSLWTEMLPAARELGARALPLESLRPCDRCQCWKNDVGFRAEWAVSPQLAVDLMTRVWEWAWNAEIRAPDLYKWHVKVEGDCVLPRREELSDLVWTETWILSDALVPRSFRGKCIFRLRDGRFVLTQTACVSAPNPFLRFKFLWSEFGLWARVGELAAVLPQYLDTSVRPGVQSRGLGSVAVAPVLNCGSDLAVLELDFRELFGRKEYTDFTPSADEGEPILTDPNLAHLASLPPQADRSLAILASLAEAALANLATHGLTSGSLAPPPPAEQATLGALVARGQRHLAVGGADVIMDVSHEEAAASIEPQEASMVEEQQQAGRHERLALALPLVVPTNERADLLPGERVILMTLNRRPKGLMDLLQGHMETMRPDGRPRSVQPLRTCMEALVAEGHNWRLLEGALVFVRPEQYRATLQAAMRALDGELRPSHLIFSESLEQAVEEVLGVLVDAGCPGARAKSRVPLLLEAQGEVNSNAAEGLWPTLRYEPPPGTRLAQQATLVQVGREASSVVQSDTDEADADRRQRLNPRCRELSEEL